MADQRETRFVFVNPLEQERITRRGSLCEMSLMASVFMTLISIYEVNIFTKIFEVEDPFLWELLLTAGLSLLGYCLGAIFPIGMNEMIPIQGCWCMTMIPSTIALILSFFYEPSKLNAIFFIIVFTVAFSKGLLFPTMHIMLANWTQPRRRSFVTSVVYSGIYLGSTVGILIYDASGLWKSTIRIVLICILSANCKAARISPDYNSSESIDDSDTKFFSLPVKKVCASKPFIANAIANSCCVCSSTVLDTMAMVHFNPAWVPAFCSWIFVISFGGLLTIYGSKNNRALKNSRIIATIIASLVPLVYLIFWASTGGIKSGGLMILSVILMASRFSGTVTNIIDIAPNYAGWLIAIIQVLEQVTVSVTLIPLYYIVGDKVRNDYWIQFWVILATIVSSVISVIFYWCWASVEEQPWNKPKTDDLELTTRTQMTPEKA